MLRDQEGGKVSKRVAHVPGEQDRWQIQPSRRAVILSCAEKVKAARWFQAKEKPQMGLDLI